MNRDRIAPLFLLVDTRYTLSGEYVKEKIRFVLMRGAYHSPFLTVAWGVILVGRCGMLPWLVFGH